VFDEKLLRIAAQGFAVALTVALVLMPGAIRLARRFGIVDKPGGRKTHAQVTPLLGGFTVVVASVVAYLVVDHRIGEELDFQVIYYVIAGSLVLFLIGLIDDLFKESMTFQPKLLGQVIGVLVLMWPGLVSLWDDPAAGLDRWLYQLFFLCWYLAIVNSFNFSDNMNGLMSGLSVIALAAAIFYLQSQESSRTMMVAVMLMGAVLGFMPYNFPRSRVFLGDAGSLFIGYWLAWIMFDLVGGIMGVPSGDMGLNHLVPAVLVMGIPLFDAAFVVVMRFKEGRPIYLGDNHHLSHRLVRGGFTHVEAVIILWGLGLILASMGILALHAQELYRYLIFGASVLFMVMLTLKVMALERAHLMAREEAEGGDGDSSLSAS
jgi:UDP-GlcNAc:undecaprenyl-phosphate GlcNAc-1-phosphate transferase